MSGTAAIYQKAGIVYEDHHMKDKEGNYQASPPRELKTLYDYLPSEKDSASEKKIPERLCLQGEINALKAQTHACGVYTLLHEEQRPWKGKKEDAGDVKNALWKHATEDLVIGLSKSSSSENVWIVAQWSTFATKPQVCMKITAALPYDAKGVTWSEWDGRDWIPAPSVKCRPSFHGWGLDKLDKTRLKFSPGSPDGSY